MALEFAGQAVPLSDTDIAEVAASLGIERAVVAAVADVESSGNGFLPDKRPKILFEAHVFFRLTNGRFGQSNISAPAQDHSLYGASGAHQYDRLAQAISLDRDAALQSASWGRWQIMGFNHEACGFADVETFVAAMMTGERAHLDAFAAFCRSMGLVPYLAALDWEQVALRYNGKGQIARYAALLEQAYRDYAEETPEPPVVPLPSDVDQALAALVEPVKRAQSALHDAGIFNGRIDGDPGPRTWAAILAYRRKSKAG